MTIPRSALLLCLAGTACVFRPPGEPPRHFCPMPPPDDGALPTAATNPLALRLYRVRSAAHLKDRIVWRSSDVELGFYDQRLWTELPATYVERALVRELYERRGYKSPRGDVVPALVADVRAFEETFAPRHAARIEAAVSLGAGRCRLLQRTFTVERPIEGADAAALPRAMGLALDDLAHAVGDAVAPAMSEWGKSKDGCAPPAARRGHRR